MHCGLHYVVITASDSSAPGNVLSYRWSSYPLCGRSKRGVKWKVTEKYVGRNKPLIEWRDPPSRSLGLTPLDVYLWRIIKARVYKNRPQNSEELCHRIARSATQEITPT